MNDHNSRLKVAGVFTLLAGLFLVVWTGLGTLMQDRDPDGYLMSQPLTIERPSPVVVSNDIGLLRGHYECVREDSFVGFLEWPDDVRVTATTSGSQEVFVGIAPADAVAAYLDGVAHDEITDWECDRDRITPVEYRTHDGPAAPAAPAARNFWTASVSGTGPLTLDWTIERGEWAVVIMDTSGSSGLSADVRFGALAPSAMAVIGWISIAVGLPLLIAGGAMLFIGIRRDRRARASRPDHAGVDLPPPPEPTADGPAGPRAERTP